MASITIEQNDLDVLKALDWWCKGFRAAFPPGYCSMPNTVAITQMIERMEKALTKSNEV